jgi:hypothetical protein
MNRNRVYTRVFPQTAKRNVITTLTVITCAVGITFGSALPASAQNGGAGLADLLAFVPDNDISRTVIHYGSRGDLQEALGVQVTSDSEVAQLQPAEQAVFLNELASNVYYSPFSGLEYALQWQETLAINPYAVERELVVGEEPEWFAVLNGSFDSSAISGALTGYGYTLQTAGDTQFLASAGNTPASTLARNNFNNVYVSNDTVIAAPESAALIDVFDGGEMLLDDPAYAALASALGDSISAVLFDADYLTGAGNQTPLPAYSAAGIGYTFDGTTRTLTVAAVYADQASAQAAVQSIAQRIPAYRGGSVFGGWAVEAQVAPTDNQFVALVTLQPNGYSMAWLDLARNNDLGFLAAQ